LDFTLNQVQNNMGLANIPDSRHLDLTISQVQGNEDHPLAYPWK
jgi:hypothetical protein